ncbi:MAG: flagellar biosynthetic protein FliQ [Pseudomonadota bacterium]
MEDATIISNLTTSLYLFMLIALPPLGAAVAVGLAIGIFQAATQIQDQTLPQAVKLFVVLLVLAISAPFFVAPLIAHAELMFTTFPMLTR